MKQTSPLAPFILNKALLINSTRTEPNTPQSAIVISCGSLHWQRSNLRIRCGSGPRHLYLNIVYDDEITPLRPLLHPHKNTSPMHLPLPSSQIFLFLLKVLIIKYQ